MSDRPTSYPGPHPATPEGHKGLSKRLHEKGKCGWTCVWCRQEVARARRGQ